jgi:putative hydrolases of HD superfamily
MAFVVSSLPGYDAQKCVKMALVHDLAEALVGDITPHDGVTKAEKHAREEAAMTRMQLTLTGAVQDGESSSSAASATIAAKIWSTAGDEMLALWQEYEACSSPEALLLKDLDKLEMIMQAYEYEQATGQPLDEFFRSTAGAFLSPVGIALSDEVRARRAKLAEEQSDSGAAKAARTVAAIGDDLADLGQLGDGFGA